MTTTPPDNAGLADGLDCMRRTILHWMEFDKKDRDAEGLETTDGTHIMCPPTWPSYGMLKHWAAALEAATALRPPVWMDISTAPKDGTPIIALYSLFGKDAVEVIRWIDLTYLNVDGSPAMPKPKWIRFDGKEFPNPTHWMPLPPAPTPPKAPTP